MNGECDAIVSLNFHAHDLSLLTFKSHIELNRFTTLSFKWHSSGFSPCPSGMRFSNFDTLINYQKSVSFSSTSFISLRFTFQIFRFCFCHKTKCWELYASKDRLFKVDAHFSVALNCGREMVKNVAHRTTDDANDAKPYDENKNIYCLDDVDMGNTRYWLCVRGLVKWKSHMRFRTNYNRRENTKHV